MCPKYDSLREHLVSIVCNDNPNFVFLSVNDKELSHGSPLTHRKIDNDIHNVLCQQLARRQDHAGPYVVRTYIAQ